MSTVLINIGKQFSMTPGGRYRHEGKWSGEEFRETFLEPQLKAGNHVIVELDGPEGYMSSFLDEVFGELVRARGPKILDQITITGSPVRQLKARYHIDRAKAQWAADQKGGGGTRS